MQSDKFIMAEGEEFTPMAPGLKRHIMGYGKDLMLVKVVFEYPGALAAPHSHHHAQSSMIMSGKFIFTVGGESRTVCPGDGIYMEADIEHSCECIEPGIVIDTFSPAREDFLK